MIQNSSIKTKYQILLFFNIYLFIGTGYGKNTTDYMALFIGGAKSGYMVSARDVTKDTVTTTITLHMQITRGPNTVTMLNREEHRETKTGKPLSFFVEVSGIGTNQVIRGTIKNSDSVEVVQQVGSQSKHLVVPWPKNALLTEGLRLVQVSKGCSTGAMYTVSCYQPALLEALVCTISFKNTTNHDLLGRVVTLTEMQTSMVLSVAIMTTHTYVDKDLRAQKISMPLMGMDLTFISCDSAYAISPNEPNTFFQNVMVKAPKPITKNQQKARILYSIVSKSKNGDPSIVSTDEQRVNKDSDRGVTSISVDIVPLPEIENISYTGNSPEILAALEANEWIQSDDVKIVKLSKQAIGKAKKFSKVVKNIESFVHTYMRHKNLSVGYATAVEVAESKEGDCTEHAVLTAALCRAQGIPARIVIGLAYADSFYNMDDLFVPHAWVQVFCNTKWYSIDAALGSFDTGHIAFSTGNGSPQDFFSQITTLGNIIIKDISYSSTQRGG